MMRVVSTLILCLFYFEGRSQFAAIEQEHPYHVLYACIDNPITVAVNGCDASSVVVTTNNGDIEVVDKNKGRYILKNLVSGNADIRVGCKTGNLVKQVHGIEYRVNHIPPGEPRLGNEQGGVIEKMWICIARGLYCPTYCHSIYIPRYNIISYYVGVYRNDTGIFSRKLGAKPNAGIDSITHAFFKTLQNGDRVVFSNITAIMCDRTKQLLKDVELTITEAEKYHDHEAEYDYEEIDSISGQKINYKY